MKKQVLEALAKIKAVAEATGIKGKVSIEFDGCTLNEWDNVI